MSISEWRCRELRRLADKLGNKEKISVPFVRVLVIPIMREAADTIECLRDRLQSVPAELDCIEDKSRWYELFGTPERAARTIMGKQLTYDLLTQCDDCPYQTDECYEPSGKCAMDEYNTLLEWLRGES
jgi:hypothetical protein